MSDIFKIQFPGNPPLIPAHETTVHRSRISAELVKGLEDVVEAERENILNTTPKPPPGKPVNWLTGRLWHYNFFDFDYDAVRKYKDFAAEQYIDYIQKIGGREEATYIRCWANYCKFSQLITWHNHSDAHSDHQIDYGYISGNLCVRTFDTNTYFRSPYIGGSQYSKEVIVDMVGVKNVDAELIQFPSYLYHKTDENMTQTPRITISYDIITERVYNKIGNPLFCKLL
jgi:hypothetical protein